MKKIVPLNKALFFYQNTRFVMSEVDPRVTSSIGMYLSRIGAGKNTQKVLANNSKKPGGDAPRKSVQPADKVEWSNMDDISDWSQLAGMDSFGSQDGQSEAGKNEGNSATGTNEKRPAHEEQKEEQSNKRPKVEEPPPKQYNAPLLQETSQTSLNENLEKSSLQDWQDLKQFDDDHDKSWFEEEEKRLAEKYGGPFIKAKYTCNGRPGYYCELCFAEMNSKNALEAHCCGMKHLKKKDQYEKLQGQKAGSENSSQTMKPAGMGNVKEPGRKVADDLFVGKTSSAPHFRERPFEGFNKRHGGRALLRDPVEDFDRSRDYPRPTGRDERDPYARGPYERNSYRDDTGDSYRRPGRGDMDHEWDPYARGKYPQGRDPYERPIDYDRDYNREDPYARPEGRDGYDKRDPYSSYDADRGPVDKNAFDKAPLIRDPYSKPVLARDPYSKGPADKDPYRKPVIERDPYEGPIDRDRYGMSPDRDPYRKVPIERGPYAAPDRDPYGHRADRDTYGKATRDPYGMHVERDHYRKSLERDPHGNPYEKEPYDKTLESDRYGKYPERGLYHRQQSPVDHDRLRRDSYKRSPDLHDQYRGSSGDHDMHRDRVAMKNDPYRRSKEPSPGTVPPAPAIPPASSLPPAAKPVEKLAGGPTGALLQKLADCCVKNNDDADLALNVMKNLAKSLKEYHEKQGETRAATLMLEAELKLSSLKVLKASVAPISAPVPAVAEAVPLPAPKIQVPVQGTPAYPLPGSVAHPAASQPAVAVSIPPAGYPPVGTHVKVPEGVYQYPPHGYTYPPVSVALSTAPPGYGSYNIAALTAGPPPSTAPTFPAYSK